MSNVIELGKVREAIKTASTGAVAMLGPGVRGLSCFGHTHVDYAAEYAALDRMAEEDDRK